MTRIKVKNSGIIKLKVRRKFPKGSLFSGEALREIPFKIKRIYFIRDIAEGRRIIRGNHAHKRISQVIFCLHGNFRLTLDDGDTKQSIMLKNPTEGVLLGPKLWMRMSDFSLDCVILVLASDYYEEDEYLRDYKYFLKFVAKK